MLKLDHSLAWNNMVILLDNIGKVVATIGLCDAGTREAGLEQFERLLISFTITFAFQGFLFSCANTHTHIHTTLCCSALSPVVLVSPVFLRADGH